MTTAPLPAHALIGDYLAMTGWADNTLHRVGYALNALSRWLDTNTEHDIASATRADLIAWRDARKAEVSRNTQADEFKYARAMYRWLHADGALGKDGKRPRPNPIEGINVAAVTKTIELAEIAPHEYRRLIAGCDRTTVAGCRDEAIMALAYHGGLRVSEIAGIDVDDLSDDGLVQIGSATFVTKSRETRTVDPGPEAWTAIRRYLRRQPHDGPLFLGQHDNGTDRRLNARSIGGMVHRRCKATGTRLIGMHEFRRACAGNLLDAGVAEGDVMYIMGWSHRELLDRYVRTRRKRMAIANVRAKVHAPAKAKMRRTNGARIVEHPTSRRSA